MSTEITTLPANEAGGALGLIQQAMQSGLSPEHLEKLLAVKKDWEADEARKVFSAAVASFQGRCPIIEKGDKAYDKDYARIDRIWRTIRPLMDELGLSVTWNVCELREAAVCHVEGYLRHKQGHSERLVMDCPLPALIKTKSGNDAQNVAQQMGSAYTYAKRYAMCAALGIVTGDDDDGHAAGAQFVTYQQAEELEMLMQTCRGIAGFDEAKFWAWAQAERTADIIADKYVQAKQALEKRIKGAAK